MLLICPARGKLLRRAGQYLVAGVRISCGGRQKTKTIGLLTLAYQTQRLPFLDAKIQKKSQKCKKTRVFFYSKSGLVDSSKKRSIHVFDVDALCGGR